jgi:hypothetical protein
VDATVLVDARGGAREIALLGMRCDEREIPAALSGTEPVGEWLIFRCMFAGSAMSGGERETLGEAVEGTVEGTAALAVVEDRVIGIVSPDSASAPALWWSWSLASTTVEAHGTRGLFKKRPEKITLDRDGGLDGGGDTLLFEEVARNWGRKTGFQTGQEQSLLEALGG